MLNKVKAALYSELSPEEKEQWSELANEESKTSSTPLLMEDQYVYLIILILKF